MDKLTKQIKRDFFDIRENINNPDKLMELFSFSKKDFDIIVHNLKFSVEDGLFEYKSTCLNLILDPLMSLQYDSRAMTSYSDQINRAKGLLAVTLIQRLIAVGAVKISDNKGEAVNEVIKKKIEQPGIKEIIDFVQKEPKINPLILQDTLFKKIIMHIKMYKNESQKMGELMAKVSTEKKIALKRNFDISLGKQVSKMGEAYNEIINKAVKKEQAPEPRNILLKYDFKPMGKFYISQIEVFSTLLSSLTFAKNEKFHTRELLLDLTKKKEQYQGLIEGERKEYSKIIPFDKDGKETGKAFTKRTIIFLEKERDWLRIHPGK
jgi:hypothetical protein